MSKVKASGASRSRWLIAIYTFILALPVLLTMLVVNLIRSGQFLTQLPASVGLPAPIVVPIPTPTVAPPPPVEPRIPQEVPTEPPPPAQPEVLPPPTPIPAPAPIIPPVFPSDVEPVPVECDPGDGDSAASNLPQVACGVRVVHVVRPGENLFRIALRYNTTIVSIARRNGIADMRTIRPGQRLTIVACR